MKHFRLYVAIVVVPALMFGSLDLILVEKEAKLGLAYNSVRMISISFNAAVYMFTTWRLRDANTSHNDALQAAGVLASKMKFFPISQIVCRLPTTLYQLIYGVHYNSLYGHVSAGQGTLLFLSALLTPAKGLAFLFIFLKMQPFAKMKFMQMLRNVCCCCEKYFER
jgi:hypothetical protein